MSSQAQAAPPLSHSFSLEHRGTKIKLEGSREFVEKHMPTAALLLGQAMNSSGSRKSVNEAQLTLPWGSEDENEPSAATESPFNGVASTEIEQQSTPDLVSYYRQLVGESEVNQRAQLLIITRHGSECDMKTELDFAHYEAAFAKLRAIPVKPPASIRASLSEMKKDGLIYQPSEGTYAATDKGRKRLGEWLSGTK